MGAVMQMPPIAIDLHRLLFACMLTVVAFSGCMRPMRYYYLSLENVPGAKVERSGRPDLPHALVGAGEMPIQYSLPRSGYVLQLEIDPAKFGPRVVVAAKDLDGNSLRGVPCPDRTEPPPNRRRCGSYDPWHNGDAFEYAWLICSPSERADERVIHFDVVDQDGQLVAAESVPFDLEPNGIYFVPEGL